jgi:hypothetical protein
VLFVTFGPASPAVPDPPWIKESTAETRGTFEHATEQARRRKVPPAATPLGLVLLAAGCRWFKDWYFPEGGREGGTKLQELDPRLDWGGSERMPKTRIA